MTSTANIIDFNAAVYAKNPEQWEVCLRDSSKGTVRILTPDPACDKKVVGIIYYANGFNNNDTWDLSGNYYTEHPGNDLDLVLRQKDAPVVKTSKSKKVKKYSCASEMAQYAYIGKEGKNLIITSLVPEQFFDRVSKDYDFIATFDFQDHPVLTAVLENMGLLTYQD